MRDSIPLETLRAAEDKLLAEGLDIVQGLMDFASLGFDEQGRVDEHNLPLEWLALPIEQKARKIRLARYGCLPSKDIPHGAKVAVSTVIGIIKSRATENSGTKILNLEVSTFPAPAPLTEENGSLDADFEVIDLE